MLEYRCKRCGNKETFRIQLYGKVIVKTNLRHGRQEPVSIDTSDTDIVDVFCESCGGCLSRGEVIEK